MLESDSSRQKLELTVGNATQGLPRSGAPPTMPRAQRGLPQKRMIPYVKQVLVVASGKGGVGKSTVSGMRAIKRPRLGRREHFH